MKLVPRSPDIPTSEVDSGPIEAAARRALAPKPDDPVDALAELRREVVFRAAAVMDNPKAAPFFKSAADVLRTMVEDLLAAQPRKDGEADELAGIMAALGVSRRRGSARRGTPSVDDAEESGAGDDR